MKISTILDQAISTAMAKAGAKEAPAVVRQASRPEFGHYQANGIMGAAKRSGSNPRELATGVVAALDLPIASSVEIAGPGFLNIHLSPAYVAEQLQRLTTDQRLGIELRQAKKILVDYSSPNLAKEMHIGHLRTTAIGDAIVRMLEFLGHDVVRTSHVGDWGAQFGSLLAYLDTLNDQDIGTELSDLEAFYRLASEKFRNDETFAARAREAVVKLQNGDKKYLSLWERFIDESIRHCETVYDALDISLAARHVRGESSYNNDLADTLAELEENGLIEESDGALCVFLDEFRGKDGKPLPAIVRKSDGGYPYMATDLAAVRYRVRELHVDSALYVVGAPQTLHFQQVFAVARKAGFIADQDFRHLPFGSILKSDGKMFKTRDGADVKLIDVADEANTRAFEVVSEKNPSLSENERRQVARVIGPGAMKYAELSKNRTTDYIFDWDTMLSFDGNTAPYLQYAYTRARGVFRRADLNAGTIQGTIILYEPAEMALGVKLLQFEEALDATLEDYQPNLLCNYLFELAGTFSTFYETCPVLKAEGELRQSRLLLCDLTARTLQTGLSLLGIKTVEQM